MRKDWKIDILKNLCEVFDDGNWIESKDQSPFGIRLIQTGNIGFGFFKDKEDKSRYISEETFDRLKCTEIFPGDLLVSRLPDPVGKSCIIPDLNIKMITGVDCTIVRPKKFLKTEFLKYYQMSDGYLNDVKAKVTGTTRSRISRKNLGMIEIPIPPVEEQQKIVEKLDKAFELIDQAKANIEQNIINAKELFQSKLDEVFSQKGDGWTESKLGEIALVTAGQSPEGKYYNSEGNGMPFYQGKKEFTDKYIGNPVVWTSKVTKIAKEGDVLMSVRAPVGPVNFATQECCIGRGLASIRALGNFDRGFLFHFFKYIEKQLIGNSGAVFNSINKSQIENLAIIYPEINKQKTINKELIDMNNAIDSLILKYQQKLSNIEELRKSILERAFKGELTN